MALTTIESGRSLKKPKPMSTNTAIASAARDLDVDVVSAYPITPQTTVVEKIAEFIANGELNAE
nr:ferredoxin oxidoreductase [Desulfurococcales archaeon]